MNCNYFKVFSSYLQNLGSLWICLYYLLFPSAISYIFLYFKVSSNFWNDICYVFGNSEASW